MMKEKYYPMIEQCNSMTEKTFAAYRLFRENKKNISIIRRAKKLSRGATDAERWLIENYEKIIAISNNIDAISVSTTNRIIFLVDSFVSDADIELNKESFYDFFQIVEKVTSVTTKQIDCLLDVFYLRIIREIAEACRENAEKLPMQIRRIYEIASIDFESISSHFSPLEKKLRADKSGVYSEMTKETQKLYQKKLLFEAKTKGISVEKLCDEKMKKAEEEEKHFGFFLGKRSKQFLYYPLLLVFYFILLFDFVFSVSEPILIFFLSIPLFYFCKGVFDFVCSRSVGNEILPAMRVERVRDEEKTVATITALITSEKDIEKLCEKLKTFKQNNRTQGDELYFGLLCDFPESKKETSIDDIPLKKKLCLEIAELNQEDGCFFAVVRKRVFHKSEGKYVGWERKRGAIESFIHWLHCGKASSDMEFFGVAEKLIGAKYLITLDADTHLGIGQAKDLIGIASHPLNVPVIGQVNGKSRVVSGHGIIQPKMTTSLLNPIKTPFGKIVGNGSGEILYSGASFDFMQTLYHEGNFCGKGIIHIPSYDSVLYNTFPEQKILSHDMPEGVFLRCGLASNIFFSDSEPQDAQSYYKRQHRWIRGDVQNLALLFQLPLFRKVFLFENIGRYLVPLCEISLMFFSSFFGAKCSAVCFFLVLLFHFRSAMEAFCDFLLQRNFQIFHRRFFTKMRNLILNSFYKSMISVSAIAFEAYYFTDAVIRALYRMTVSKKKLLEWQVYSPFSNKKDPMLFYFPSLILTCAYLFFSQSYFTLVFGIFWLCYPLTAIRISLPYKQKMGWSLQNKKTFFDYAKKEFSFFEACVGNHTNHLPPDNIQIHPREKVAMRTSPTNIGMYLMSLISAKDFGLIGAHEAIQKIEKTLESVEKMEHVNGHLFNWYDIEDLSVIGDRFVSTVDSGNFIASLICVQSALKEINDTDGSVKKLIKRIEHEIKNADFRLLYDFEKKLFYVGYYPDTKTKTVSHYDHYMSEARITMFMCIALGQIPVNSWISLSRPLLSFNGNVGIGSWSGTAFEYFMPTLFLPVVPNSMEDESLEYAYYCQKRFGANHPDEGTVFGISESGYSLTDDMDNYQYKAFGVPYLSTQGEGFGAKVISPYSSFLMLERGKADVISNLSVLEEMGLVGDFGFYEACEFNSNFIDDYVIVSSYMAHHKGMSMISLANAAFKNVFVNRFLSFDGFMSKTELLSERFPIEGKVFKKKKVASYRAMQRFSRDKSTTEHIEQERRKGKIYSDGKISLIAYSDGKNRLIFNGKDLIDPNCGGVICKIETPTETYSFCENCSNAFIRYSDHYYELLIKSERAHILLHVEILGGMNGAIFSLEMNGITEPSKITFCLSVILQKFGEYAAHPAFHALSLEGKSDGTTLTIRRRGVEQHQYLHLISSQEFHTRFSDRNDEKCFDYKLLLSPEIQLIFTKNDIKTSQISLVLLYSEQEKAPFFNNISDNKGNPLPKIKQKTIRSLLRLNEICSYDKYCSQPESELLIKALETPKFYMDSDFQSIQQDYLWKYGISGDYPIVSFLIKDERSCYEQAETFLRVFKKMRIAGIAFDLVFLREESNGYFDAIRDKFTDILVKNKCEFLLGKHPGIHFVAADSADVLKNFYLLSRLQINYDKDFDAIPITTVKKEIPEKIRWSNNSDSDSVGTIEKCSFKIDKESFCPSEPFSHVVSNRTTGFVCNQNSLGFTWHRNAGLKRISKWINCPSEDDGEKLYLRLGSGVFDLIQSARFVNYRRHFAVYDGEILNSEYKIVVTASEKLSSKIIFIFLDEKLSELGQIIFSFIPTCGQKADKNIVFSKFDGGISYQSIPQGEYKGGAFFFAKNKNAGLIKNGERIEITVPAQNENAMFLGGFSCKEHLESIVNLIKKSTVEELLDEEACRFERFFQNKESDEDFWIRYQAMNSRYFGRTGQYQSSGAYGFRDQLQDCLIFLDTDPEITKQHILRAASHQYVEGDVQHWWHPGRKTCLGDAGIRSRCSDDYLWLIYVCDQYIKAVGSFDILDVKAPYIRGELLKNGEDEIYHTPQIVQTAPLREHLLKCVRLFISRGLGKNHLPYIGCGDWNDGMNRVDGESVWLGFFGAICLNRIKSCFSEDIQSEINQFLEQLSEGLNASFNGSWFVRAICDDGKVFGNDLTLKSECSVDLITQAFAAFYQIEFFGTKFAFKDEWIVSALTNAYEALVDEKNHTCALFQKPFVRTEPTPGYIQRYVAGVRENGGQYTHAAVWFAMALLFYGKKHKNDDLLKKAQIIEKLISPFTRIKKDEYLRYRREPYVLCGDVYTAKTVKGRGGWSWYTGAAGWYLKLKKEVDKLKKEGC